MKLERESFLEFIYEVNLSIFEDVLEWIPLNMDNIIQTLLNKVTLFHSDLDNARGAKTYYDKTCKSWQIFEESRQFRIRSIQIIF